MKNNLRFFLPLLFLTLLCTGARAQTCDLGTNDWEGSSNANPPAGWTRGGGTPNISSNVFGEQDGVAVGFNTVGESVTSPPLECVGEVSFEWHSSGQTSAFTVAVQWTQTPDDEASWQTFGTFAAVASGGAPQTQYMPLTADLPEETAVAPFAISVRWIMTQRSSGTAYIDNICFTGGACAVQPTRLTFTAVPSACIQAGAPFTVEVCATDDNGFVAETFPGNIFVSSSSPVGGAGTEPAREGCAEYTITATEAGAFTLNANALNLEPAEVALSAVELCPREENIRVFTYNLLNFPNGRTPCDQAGDVVPPNRHDTLAKIVAYFQPDVLMVCELQTEAGSDAIIRALQTVNPDFRAATFVPNQSSTVKNLNNMLYYNSAKMTLVGQQPIETNTRDISRYEMRMNDPQIATATDTVYVDFYVAHLKAGSAAGDRQRRAEDVAIFQSVFDGMPLRNAVIGGDMNFYESSEVAYQTMLTSAANPWFDPVMAPGDWDNDRNFADLHTQSARAFGTPSISCGITGGIDSRFDFLLINTPVEAATDNVAYVEGSYVIPGNNGELFNESINDPSNSSGVPFSVLNAMYNLSDHLPVQMDLTVTYPSVALPVEVLTFAAEAVGSKAVELRWTAANAADFSHYAVERLTASSWTDLGRVGDGAAARRFTDRAPAAGINHYRLRLVDTDGSVAYSPVRTVRLAGALAVYPTVTTGDAWISGADVTSVRAIDVYGRARTLAVGAGGHLSLAGLAPGWYVIRARTRDAKIVGGRVLLR